MNPPSDPDPNLNHSDANEEEFADDPALVNFLQRYQPEVPASSPDLEDRILHAVLDEVAQSPSKAHPQTSVEQARIARWGILAAITATLALFWGGSQIWQTAKQSVPPDGDPDGDLEAFVAESWSGAFDPFDNFDDPEADLLTDPWEWWGQQPTSAIAEANIDTCKRSSPCQE
ncbi:hypothetical protein [Acaryochloris sp. IP29b_bin.137]|uniref:hypothetical protein n=1 Tax=Acaryochloris sp. IP29b_bin.137 TaxID=2969217 RepID=UPI00262CAF4E|nr:hypothetical protein [Acaryochloris sp. IP29b_bin.137]